VTKDKTPVTQAVRLLRKEGVHFKDHPYKYVEKGGTSTFAKAYGVDEHRVIKTLVMEDEEKKPLVVLMHGDLQVSTKELARTIGVKRVEPCSPEAAHRYTGYFVGGISPFGTQRSLPVYMEESILETPVIYINGGKRGLLLEMDPREVLRVLKPVLVRVGIPG
jgi:Cys-tRNA(Pro) deacylase